MAVAFRANALAGNGQSATTNSLSITVPATAAAGDYAVLTVGSTNDTVTLTTPSGWTLLSGPDRVGTSASGWLYGKSLVAGDIGASVSLSFSSTQRCCAQMAVYSGVATSGATSQTAVETTTTTSPVSPTITGVTAGALLHVSWARRRGSTPPTDITIPAGYSQGTSERSATNYGSTPEESVEAAYKAATTAGSYGGDTATGSNGSVGVNYIVAIPADVVTQSGNLSGSGTLSETDAPKLTNTGSPSGTGTLSVTSTPLATRSAGLTGSGTLSTSTTQTQPGALNGLGNLTATVRLILPGTPTGTGSLTQTNTPLLTRTGALAGTGTLSAQTIYPAFGEGEGVLDAVVARITLPGLDNDGLGELTATVIANPPVFPALTGVGTLSATLDTLVTASRPRAWVLSGTTRTLTVIASIK